MTKAKAKIIVLVSITLILIVSISAIVFGVISRTSTRGTIEVSTDTLTATTAYTSKQEEYAWTYEYAGDTKEIEISTVNNSEFVLHRFYTIDKTANATNDDNLLSAIMVYYNDEYIGQLIDIIENDIEIADPYVFVIEGKTGTDSLKFELHQAASNSVFDSKNIGITVTTYTENANYLNNIFVHSENEFKRAIDDINSGLFETIPTIVLCNTITLANSYDILNPTTIYMNGATLNGTLVLNDTDALLTVLGEGTFNASVTLTSYDTTAAKKLVIENVKNAIGSGLQAGTSKDVLGHYGFYNFTITESATATYTAATHVVSAPSVDDLYYSKPSYITVAGEKVTFKLLGSKTALLENTLKHLPANDSVITTDLFLPTYIPSENAVITWTSSNEDILSSDGKIAARRIDSEEVSLLAEIKVNDTVITNVYTFKVSAHNNEINFYKLVQEISPIVINNIYSSAEDADNALYHLPIVDSTSPYDYRKSYDSPAVTKMFNWEAYRDIGLENITYTMTAQQQTEYDYITQSGNVLYLNTTTLNNYARINITGDFGNDETYTTTIHISIAVGTDTQLLEKAFTQISEELAEISVLGNILNTRDTYGMANEKGDFSLSSVYFEDSEYTIIYSGQKDIIADIEEDASENKYNFKINPEYFNEYETTVAFTATVFYREGTPQEKSKSRTFYVVVPAALHIADFTTISIYNATKYQVVNQLGLTTNTGYSKNETTLSDSNLDYILLRDIVGDETYIAEYKASDYYLEVANITLGDYTGVKTLTYNVNDTNNTAATDTVAYDFIKLIQWATSEGRVTAASVVTNTTALGNKGSTKSNNEEYLNNQEIEVLKTYYMNCTGASDDDWDDLYSEVLSQAPGYIYTNPALLNEVIASLSRQFTGDSFRNGNTATNFATLFGKYMEVIQRYAVSTTKVNANDVAPCQEIYNTRFVWTHTSAKDTAIGISNNAIIVDGTGYTSSYNVQLKDGTWWNRYNYAGGSGSDGNLSSIYARPAFAADRTSYITEAELTILRILLLNSVSLDTSGTTNLTTQFNQEQRNKIISVINANPDYYQGYTINDFDYVGEAILNAFNACMEIPTYFSTDGVAKLIKAFYDNYNETGYKLTTYAQKELGNTTVFKSIVNGNDIPYVTNLDNLKSVLSYFVNLEQLSIVGSSNLSAFLSENGIATVFARVGINNTKVNSLTMNYAAHSTVNFDLSNISNYNALTVLKLSNNQGIQSINELVNVNRKNYSQVWIENIGVEYEYQEFAIDNLATTSCTVHYTNDSGTNTYTNDDSKASDLSDLSDFNKFISKYMYMTNIVYDEESSTSTGDDSVYWRIDEGNEINNNKITKSGKYPSVTTIGEMNQLISPFYYCSESFTYNYKKGTYEFEQGHIYKIGYSGNSIMFDDLGLGSITDTTNINVDGDSLDLTNFTPQTTTKTFFEESGSNSSSLENTITWYAENDVNITVTLASQYYWYNKEKQRYISYKCFSNIPNVTRSQTTNNTTSGTNRLYFLSEENVNKILNKELKTNSTISEDIYLEERYYLCFVYNNELYFVGNKTDTIGNDEIISATPYKNNALTWIIVEGSSDNDYTYYYVRIYENQSFWIRSNNNNWLTYHSQYDNRSQWRIISHSNTDSVTYAWRPNITANYYDGTKDTYYAYSAGYDVVKLEGVTLQYTDLKEIVSESKSTSYKYYLYTGSQTTINGVTLNANTIIRIYSNYNYEDRSISRKYTYSNSTVYVINYWYKEFSYSDKEYITDPTLIESVEVNTHYTNNTYYTNTIKSSYPSNILDEGTKTPYVYIYNNTEYSQGDASYSDMEYLYNNLISDWVLNSTVIIPFATYTTNLTSTNTELLDKQIEFYYGISDSRSYIFRYSGTTATENIYSWNTLPTSTNYTNKYAYNLIVSNGILKWNFYATSVTDDGATSMDSILATANQHFGDNQYGYYYGRYYAYGENATARYISSGIYVRPGYIYRIMPNAKNTAFEWVEVQSYTTDTSDNILIALGTGNASVGDIFYSTTKAAFGFFNPGWYKVIIDEKTNVVNLVKFNDMGITITNDYTQLTNDKLVARTGDYLGYSGTFTVQISALIRIKQADNSYKEYIKTYKMKFVGSLTS